MLFALSVTQTVQRAQITNSTYAGTNRIVKQFVQKSAPCVLLA